MTKSQAVDWLTDGIRFVNEKIENSRENDTYYQLNGGRGYEILKSLILQIRLSIINDTENFFPISEAPCDRSPRTRWFWLMIEVQDFTLCKAVEALSDGKMQCSLVVSRKETGIRLTKTKG